MQEYTKRTVIFDFDGTIADSFFLLLDEAVKLVPNLDTKSITPVQIDYYKGKTLPELLKFFNISYLQLLFHLKNTRKRVNDNFYKVKPFAGIGSVLGKLKTDDVTLFILSSNQKRVIQEFLHKHELEYFTKVYSELDILGKHLALNRIIRTNGLDKSKVYYVGDEVRDIQASKKSGVHSVVVTWGFNNRKVLEAQKPEFIADSMDKLLEVLGTF